MYKIIDTEKWNRKTQYEWFNSFSNPCYGIDIELDVTRIVQYSKASHTSFFINFFISNDVLIKFYRRDEIKNCW